MRFLFALIFVCLSQLLTAQTVKTVKTDVPIKLPTTPKKFFISNVVDVRADTAQTDTIKTPEGKTVTIKYKDGLAKWVNNCFKKDMGWDSSGYGFELRIKRWDIKRSMRVKQPILNLNVAFDLYLDNNHIYWYEGNRTIELSPAGGKTDPSLLALPLAIMLFENGFTEFGEWLSKNEQYFSKTVKMTVEMDRSSEDSTRLFFDPSRLLTASDFQFQPPTGEERTTNPISYIRYRYFTDKRVNQKTIRVVIEPTFDKHRSQLIDRTNINDVYYSQVLFDITALKACEFFGLLRTTEISYDDPEKHLDGIYMQVERSLEQMTNDYIKESDYATNIAKHNEWATGIRKQLSNCACYQ